MKRIQKTRLRFTEGNSDKVYEVDLLELSGTDEEAFVVNYRYGRHGSNLREGSKTPTPVTREKAQKVYDSIVVSKLNKGYIDIAETSHSPGKSSYSSTTDSSRSAIKNTILSHLDNPPDNWPLSRIIYRAGELHIKEAADILSKFPGTILDEDDDEDFTIQYSIAWSLGRCGNENHIHALETRLKSPVPAVQRIAREAYLAIAPKTQVEMTLSNIKNDLPHELQQCIDLNNGDELAEQIISNLCADGKYNVQLLENIYALARSYSSCHQATLKTLQKIPLKEMNYFLIFRHLFRMSEFRLDSSIYSLIAMRIEETPASSYYDSPIYRSGTREYLRKRIWRTLRKLGEAGNDQYTAMAAGILSTFSDEHGKEPRETIRTQWNWNTRENEIISSTYYDPFSDYLALNHILYKRSAQYAPTTSGKAWHKISDTPDTTRTEAFPKLWDEAPETVLQLLIKSRCSIVHTFCTAVLMDNREYCQTIPTETLCQLLSSTYENTGAFSFELAKERYNPDQPDFILLAACIGSNFSPARVAAIQWIDAQLSKLNTHTDLLATILVSRFEGIRQWGIHLLKTVALSSSEVKTLLHQVIAKIRDLEPTELAESVTDITTLLLEHFREPLQKLDIEVIAELLNSPNLDIQFLGASLLLGLDIPGEDLPADILSIVNHSSSEKILGIGVSLLAKFSDGYLLDQEELLLSYCISDIDAIRSAVIPIIKRVAKNNTHFADTFFRELVALLFVTEKSEGQHSSFIKLITSALAAPLQNIDKNLRWRLLHAKSKGAQRLGAISLEEASYSDYSIRQWATLANSPTLRVRQWVMAAYASSPDDISKGASDALRILNSKWQDSRDFGVDYFRNNFNSDDWTPTIIIGICDSTRDDIQRFGRELITDFFAEGDGVEYLTKLSQHPSRNVQLFTTNYLSSFASDDLGKLQQLRPYFLTVLSNVCKGRVAKDRVTLFLLAEALKSEATASFVAEIFDRQSVTYSLTDKAAYIEAMCAIHSRYPTVTLPLTVKALPVKNHRSLEVNNAI